MFPFKRDSLSLRISNIKIKMQSRNKAISTMRFSRAFLITLGIISAVSLYLWANNQLTFSSLSNQLGRALSETNIETALGKSYGPEARHKLDIYTPSAENDISSGPIVIFYYGGGWRNGERKTYHFVGAALASQGITTVIPDYRLYPDVRFPTFVEDAALAYTWVWNNLANTGSTPRPIIVMGHSAGAHIAALLSLDLNYLNKFGETIPQPDAFVGLAGPYAFDPTTWRRTRPIFATASNNADLTRPVTFANKNAPPSLLLHGTDDGIVKLWNTVKLSRALNEVGAKSKKIELANIGHFGIILSLARPFRWRAPVLDEIIGFVKAQT